MSSVVSRSLASPQDLPRESPSAPPKVMAQPVPIHGGSRQRSVSTSSLLAHHAHGISRPCSVPRPSAISSSPTNTSFSDALSDISVLVARPVSPVLSLFAPTPPPALVPSPVRQAGFSPSPPSPVSPISLPSSNPSSKPSSRSPSRTGAPRAKKFSGFLDGVRGALDPNRMACASAPEPVRTVVFGAETETGLAVCRALLHARHYALVALVVDINTPATAELREEGVRVVPVDMDNPASYARELEGAKAVYMSTNVLALHAILQHQPEPHRTNIARQADRCQLSKAIDACAKAKTGHVIFRVNACGHEVAENVFGKNELQSPEDLIAAKVPHTILHTTVPYERVEGWLNRTSSGLKLDVPVPDDIGIPFYALEQTGDYVVAALKNPKRWVGKDMHAVAEVMTPTELAARLSKISARPVETLHATRAEFDSLATHEKLTCRWDAWAQLVRHEYDFSLAKETKCEVPHEWRFADWMAADRSLRKALKECCANM